MFIVCLLRETFFAQIFMCHNSGTQVSDRLSETQPKEILCIPNAVRTLRDPGIPHLLRIFPGIIIAVEICTCLLSWFLLSKLAENRSPQGYSEYSNNTKSQALCQKATCLRFCQSSGRHSGYVLLNNPVLPGWACFSTFPF